MTFTYLWVALWVMVPAYVLLGRASRRLPRPTILSLTLGILVLTLVFDNLIVGLGIVAYDSSKILGLREPIAPIEDFAYLMVGVILIPVLWQYLGGKTTNSPRPSKKGTDD